MPNLTIEFSAGIEAEHDLDALCDALYEALAAHPAVPNPASIKIRTLPCPHWRIGTQPQSFAHGTLILYKGRDDDTKADMSATLLGVMDAHLPGIGSLSVDVGELGAAYKKRVL